MQPMLRSSDNVYVTLAKNCSIARSLSFVKIDGITRLRIVRCGLFTGWHAFGIHEVTFWRVEELAGVQDQIRRVITDGLPFFFGVNFVGKATLIGDDLDGVT